MSDLIRREDALAVLCFSQETGQMVCGDLRKLLEEIKAIPSTEPERKKGKWIEQDDGWDGVYYECSCCKEAFTLLDGTPSDNLYNFCPNCGAKLDWSE